MLDSPIKQPGFRSLTMATAQAATGFTNTNTRFDCRGLTFLAINVSGTATGLVISCRAELFDSADLYPPVYNLSTGLFVTNITANGNYFIDVSGFENMKFNVTSISSGAVTLKVRGSASEYKYTDRKVSLNSYGHKTDLAYISASGLNQTWATIDNTDNYNTLILDVTNSSANGSIGFRADGALGVLKQPVYDVINGNWTNDIITSGIYKVDITGMRRWNLATVNITTGNLYCWI